MSSKPDYKTIAAQLINGDPLDFKAYPDGTLVVIAPTGQKFKFTAGQVQAALHSITPESHSESPPEPKPDPKPSPKPPSKRGRPSKAKSKSEKVSG